LSARSLISEYKEPPLKSPPGLSGHPPNTKRGGKNNMIRFYVKIRCTCNSVGFPALDYKLGPYETTEAADAAWQEFRSSRQPDGYTCKASIDMEISK